MKRLDSELYETIRHAPGSAHTRAQREQTVRQLREFLDRVNISPNRVTDLKPGMVMRWVADMRDRGLSPGTIKNRLANLRAIAPKVLRGFDKNDRLGVPERCRAGTKRAPTAEELASRLERITDLGIRATIRLQAEFGLRAMESLKAPGWLDRWEAELTAGKPITLAAGSAGGAKGGRGRYLEPANRASALAAVQYARQVAAMHKDGHLVVGKAGTLKSAYDRLQNVARRAGFTGKISLHANRYGYAQERVQSLREQGYTERQAQTIVVQDLGHGAGRLEIAQSVYLRGAS